MGFGIIRMGLLATGAAHELGTPLSTISVILGDWKKMNLKKDLIEDVKIIESQLNRCKKILSEILIDSGKERLEKATIVPLKEAFDELIKEWMNSRKPQNLIYNFAGKSDKKILLEDILTQAFFNIFDNALEESPAFISVSVLVVDDNFLVSVEDQGKGFDPEIIKQIGKPNLTTKNSSGLGLFLALNTLHRIGGDLKIENLSTGGAKILVTLPLKNL